MLGPALRCAAERFDCLALIKPQFEVGRAGVGKGGVVRDAQLRRQALIDVGEAAIGLGAAVLGYASSGLPGRRATSRRSSGSPSRRGAGWSELEPAAREVEP